MSDEKLHRIHDENQKVASIDWDGEELWDHLDESFTMRDLDPLLEAFVRYLIRKGWTPPDPQA